MVIILLLLSILLSLFLLLSTVISLLLSIPALSMLLTLPVFFCSPIKVCYCGKQHREVFCGAGKDCSEDFFVITFALL